MVVTFGVKGGRDAGRALIDNVKLFSLLANVGDATFKALKVVLDGSIASAPDNVLIYATSNRRHLMPEYFAENLESHRVGEEIHPGEAVEGLEVVLLELAEPAPEGDARLARDHCGDTARGL